MNKWMTISIISVLAIGVIVTGVLYAQKTGKLEDAKAKITGLEGNVSTLGTGLAAAVAQVSTLEGDLAAAAAQVSTLEEDLAAAAARVSTLEGDLTAEEAAMVSTLEEVSTLEGDLATAEARVLTLKAALAAAEYQPYSELLTDSIQKHLNTAAIFHFHGVTLTIDMCN